MIRSVQFISDENNFDSLEFEGFNYLGNHGGESDFLSQVHEDFLKFSWDVGYKYKGNWWFVVEDKNAHKYKVIRDKHGYNSLFYSVINDILYVSKDIKSILKLRKFKINLKRIRSLMIRFHFNDLSETFFEDIYSLVPGHEIIVENGNLKLSQYWFPDEAKKRYYSNPNDYIEELGQIFKDSVKNNLKGSKSVASMLSGGLDSSSVVAVTAEIFKSEGRILHTYTHVPRFTGQFSNSNNTFGDESAHVRTIFEKHKNIEGNFLKSEDFSPIKSLYQYIEITSQIIQGAGAAFWALDLYSRVKSDGHDLLLTGENGNGTFSFSGVRPILPWSHPHWKNIPMRLLKDKVYLPLYSLYHELSYCDKNEIWNNNNHFLNKWSLENSDLIGHAEIEYFSLKNKLETYDQKMGNLIYLARKIRMPIGGTISSHFGFNMADPTGSEEMIEYCFSLPNEAFFGKAGATRNLVRQMMVGSLPDKIRLERKTGQQSADLVARLKYTSDEVDVALQNISSNETFKYLFDLPRINAYWNYLKNTESKLADRTMLNSFMKSLMAGLFILKYQ